MWNSVGLPTFFWQMLTNVDERDDGQFTLCRWVFGQLSMHEDKWWIWWMQGFRSNPVMNSFSFQPIAYETATCSSAVTQVGMKGAASGAAAGCCWAEAEMGTRWSHWVLAVYLSGRIRWFLAKKEKVRETSVACYGPMLFSFPISHGSQFLWIPYLRFQWYGLPKSQHELHVSSRA